MVRPSRSASEGSVPFMEQPFICAPNDCLGEEVGNLSPWKEGPLQMSRLCRLTGPGACGVVHECQGRLLPAALDCLL